MKLLLDTCTFLWILKDDASLSENAKTLFSEASNEVFLSSVSFWEIITKYQLGKLPLPEHPEQFIIKQRKAHRIDTLPLEETAIEQMIRLPDHHRDPFDRMLICQAIASGLTILTPDKLIRQYPVSSIW